MLDTAQCVPGTELERSFRFPYSLGDLAVGDHLEWPVHTKATKISGRRRAEMAACSEVRRRLSAREISYAVISAAMKIHSDLGPGLLESVYQACLAQELRDRGFYVQEQIALPVVYGKNKLEVGYRIDLLVASAVVVEIKSIEAIAPVHKAETLSYLRLSGKSLALLINFNVVHLKDGIRRFVLGRAWM